MDNNIICYFDACPYNNCNELCIKPPVDLKHQCVFDTLTLEKHHDLEHLYRMIMQLGGTKKVTEILKQLQEIDGSS